VEKGSNYINWLLRLEGMLQEMNIEFSDYDEFYIQEAIETTEQILKEQGYDNVLSLTEQMINDYVDNAIKTNPVRRDYYETVSHYVKKRLLR